MNASKILTHNQTIETTIDLLFSSKIHWCHVSSIRIFDIVDASSISVLAGIAGYVHNVMGDIWKTCSSILNIIEGTSNLYREGVV